MSTSETHSDKAISDDEDLKSNTNPYYNETMKTETLPASSNPYATLAQLVGETCTDENDTNAWENLSSWENEDGLIEDNISRMESGYGSSYSTNENGTFYSPASVPEPGPGSPRAVAYQQNEEMCDIKYNPHEMFFHPPTSSTLYYNYQYPEKAHQLGMPPPPPPPRHHMMTPAEGRPPGQYAGSNFPQHPPGFHPNMWYPNAPYGSSGYYRPYGPQRYGHYTGGYHPHDPMMDMLQLSNSGREARNRAEKNRRDKLNGSIQELSTMVPHVAESPRRVDKTAVLRFAAHGLRLQYVFGKSKNNFRPEATDSLMKLMDSFFITITCSGQIVLISSSIEQHLGHCQADLYGQNILHITHPEDHHIVKQQLIPSDLEKLFDIQPDDDSGDPRPRTQTEEENIDKRLAEDKRSFTIRLARAGPRSEPTTYELVKIEGCFRRSDSAPRGIKTSTFPSSLQLIRRSRGREDTIPIHTISGNDIVLIAVARVIHSPKIISRIMEPNVMEYKTRHLLDGRIVECDQRISLVAGYMTDEVRNLIPFTFMHQDDVTWVMVALKQMYDRNVTSERTYGQSTYRLLTRNGNFIYLQSKGYLEIDKNTNQVRSFICVNTMLDEEEGKRGMDDMKNKFSAVVHCSNATSTRVDMPASEDPQQLEKAVLCLIKNLQKSTSEDDENHEAADDEDADEDNVDEGDNEEEATSSHYSSAAKSPVRKHMNALHDSPMSTRCSVYQSMKSPSLSLVPPETLSTKDSISRSVSVVNVTAARLRSHQTTKSPLSSMSPDNHEPTTRYNPGACCCPGNEGDNCNYCGAAFNDQMVASPASSASISGKRSTHMGSSDDEEMQAAKRRRLKSTDVDYILTNSLDQLGRNLDQQLNTAIELQDQSTKYEVPNTNQRIKEIMDEHLKQSELYVNIKTEFQEQKSRSIHTNNNKSATTTKSTDPQTTATDDESFNP